MLALGRQEGVLGTKCPWMNDEAGVVCISDETGGFTQPFISFARNDERLGRSDAVGILGDLCQSACGGHVCVGRRIARDGEIPGTSLAFHELHQAHAGHATKVAQVGNFKRLNEYRCVRSIPVIGLEERHETIFHREADGGVVARMLRFGVDAYRTPALGPTALREVDHFLQRGDLEAVVVADVQRAQTRNALSGAKLLDFVEREVFGKPARKLLAVYVLRSAACGKLRQRVHIGRGFDELAVDGVDECKDVLVPSDEDAIAREDEVRFDEVCPHVDRQIVGGERMFGPIAAGTAMRDHDRRPCCGGWRHAFVSVR